MTTQKPSDDHMQNRINNIFTGSDLPAPASVKEMEAMQNRIQELEANLKHQETRAELAEQEANQNKKQINDTASSAPQSGDSSNVKSSWLTKFWSRFTSAHPSITDLRERSAASLAASFLIAIFLLIIAGAFAQISTLGFIGALTGPIMLAAIPTLFAYVLSRTKWYRAGIFIFSLTFGGLSYLSIIQQGAEADISNLIFSYVPLSLIVASTFLSSWAVFLLVGLNVALLYLIMQTGSLYLTANVGGQAGIMTTIGMVLILLTNFRKRSEQQSLQEIKTVNDELQFANTELIVGREQLELRVQDRTHDLELASEVGRTITAKVDNLYQLLSDAVEQIRTRFDLYYTQVYLTDRAGRAIILRAGTGDAGRQLLQRGHQLLISNDSLNGRAALEKNTVIVADTSTSQAFLPNPLLPKTRSEMAVPLLLGDQVVGVLDMQSERPNALNESNLPAFEALAGQLAVAIQNASLFEQANQARAEVMEQSKKLSLSSWGSFLNAVERSEKIGYVYNQNEVLPYVNQRADEQDLNSIYTSIQVAGAEVGKIQIADAPNRQWTAAERGLIQTTADQLANHIENLRLLAQSEKYRLDAEQISNRITREGWSEYLNTRNNLSEGFVYENNKVQALTTTNNLESTITQAYPIYVHNEHIGDLAVDPKDGDAESINEIISVVTQQLSSHIENLRLLEQTQQRSVDLEDAQTFLDSVIENLPNMLFVKNAEDLSFVRWNKAAEQLTGFKRDALINKNDYDFFPKDEADFFTANDRQVLLIGQVLDIPEEPLATAHLGIRYMHTRKVPIYGADGKAKYLLGISEDITERKHDQEILAQRANQLETVATVSTTASTVLNPDELLQQVVNLTKSRFNLYHAHIYLLDENWHTLLLASGAGEVGKQMVESGHAIDFNAEQSLVARSAREKQPVIVNDVRSEAGFLANPLLPNTRSEMAIPMVVGDNVLGVFDVQSDQVDAFSKDDANIYSTLASQVAVALQNARLYQEQSATVTQLRELDRLKSSFLANMSHELRTPLNSILGFTEVMLEGLDGPLTPNMDNDLKLIGKNGQHLLHLINDVLDMAKIESGKMNLVIEKFNLHEIFEDVISITSPLASEKKLKLKVETKSDHTIDVYADRTRLRQVMINLVNNALKFTEKGKVIIKVVREESNLLISVKDTGIGILPAHLEDVFSEFTQVDSSTTRKSGGTGLGLPISRKLIEMHGGKLWAESIGVEGEGSTFFVFMPIENRSAVSEPVTRKL